MESLGLTTLSSMAVRNLLRHIRRSMITISMIAVGVAGLMFHRAFAEGSYAQAIANFTDTVTGHLQVSQNGFLNSFDAELFMDDPESLSDKLRQVSGVKSLTPRVISQVLVSSATKSQGVLALGLDPDREPEVTKLHTFVVKGSFLNSGDKGGVMLGKPLAEMLGVGLNDKVVVFAQAYQGVLGAMTLRVSGLLETGGKETDNRVIFLTLDDARELLNYTNQVSSYVIKTTSTKNVPEIARRVKEQVDPFGYEVKRWDELAPEMPQWINFFDAIIQVIMVVVLIVIAVGIMNTVLMGVFERTREFGLMMALGTRRRHVVLVVLEESVLLAVMGIVFGVVLGLAVIGYYHRVGISLEGFSAVSQVWYLGSKIYPIPSAKHLVEAISLLFIDTVVFSVYPAWRAASLEPVEAMRHV